MTVFIDGWKFWCGNHEKEVVLYPRSYRTRPECPNCEILILRNGIQDLPQGTDVAEKDVFYQDSFFFCERFISEKREGEVL